MPERDDLAAVVKDDGAVGEMIWRLGNPGFFNRLFSIIGFKAD